MTSSEQKTPLTNMVDYTFRMLAKDKKLVLSSIKNNTFKDLIYTVPHMFGAAFNKKKYDKGIC